ncbi:MAG: (2Fe-2S)-binding protein [Vicinamibacteria bacterium]
MIICHCTGTTDRDIKTLVRQGRAQTALEVFRACSAGLACGGCRLAVECLVRAEEERVRERASTFSKLVPAI